MKTSLSIVCAGLMITGTSVQADTILDLTITASSGTINGAVYQQTDDQPTGTGFIDSFARLYSSGNQTMTQGYNTTTNNIFDNGSADNFNRSIVLGDVPVVNIGGVNYRQFLLDINESLGSSEQYLSLDEVQLFVGGTANASFTSFTGGVLDHDGSLVYRMDAGMDNWVALDASLNSGSGSGDMFLNVPESSFAGFSDGDVVTLFSQFGLQGIVSGNPGGVPDGDYGTSAGFEEWAVIVPAPGAFALLAAAGFAARRRRRG